MSFATIDVADELRIPVIQRRNENMEKPVTSIPGFENVFRRTDLPGICRVETVDEYILQFLIRETSSMSIRASAFVINTCNEIEAPMIKLVCLQDIHIGPLHEIHESGIRECSPSVSSSGVLRKEDKSCMTWLDLQSSRSVLYVSLGVYWGSLRNNCWSLGLR
ncbi:hypothetical protein CUMW_121940 [Citrus unshiu]|nr:hypothetical protein CUMW_121940 [Citrus unshiu]